MIFGRKKASNLDRRLQELQREMTRVSSELNSLERSQRVGGDARSQPAAGSKFAAAEPQKAGVGETPTAAGANNVAPGAENQVVANEAVGNLTAGTTSEIIGGAEGDLPLFDRYSPLSTEGRQKFANYFMAGHFKNLRPLRQDRRIVRNKAIIMVILAALVLIWLALALYHR